MYFSYRKRFCCVTLQISGGPALWHMAIHAFIADISPPDQRAFRIAMVQLATSFPRPICPLIAVALYEKGMLLTFRIKLTNVLYQ